MPLYEYRCESCDQKEEKLEKFDAPKEHDCPVCGAPRAMRREVSLTSFTLAGGGWMAQGYGKKGKKDPAPAKAEGAAAPAKAEGAAAPAAGGCAGGCACHAAKPDKS